MEQKSLEQWFFKITNYAEIHVINVRTASINPGIKITPSIGLLFSVDYLGIHRFYVQQKMSQYNCHLKYVHLWQTALCLQKITL